MRIRNDTCSERVIPAFHVQVKPGETVTVPGLRTVPDGFTRVHPAPAGDTTQPAPALKRKGAPNRI